MASHGSRDSLPSSSSSSSPSPSYSDPSYSPLPSPSSRSLSYDSYSSSSLSYLSELKYQDSRAYNTFINAIKSPATQIAYTFFLKKYMQYYSIKNVEDLLLDKHNPVAIEDKIINWI